MIKDIMATERATFVDWYSLVSESSYKKYGDN